MNRLLTGRALAATAALLALLAIIFFVFRLGNQASAGVSLDDPVVWVENERRGEILQINGATGEVTAQVSVGEVGDSLVAIPRGRDAVYLNRTTGELGVIGAVSLEVDNFDSLEPASGLLTGDQLVLLGDLSVSTDAYVVDEDLVLVVEPGAGIRLPIPTSEGLADVELDQDGALLAITADGTQVGISSGRGLVPHVTLPTPIANAPLPRLARAGSSLFVVDVARRTVNEILPEGDLGTTTCVAGSLEDVRVGRSYVTSSSAAAAVIVHDPDRNVVSVSQPSESDCFEIEVDVASTNFGDPVAVDRFGYLPNWGTGSIEVVDLEERIHVDTLRFLNRSDIEFELEVFDNAVWVNDPEGIQAGVVRGSELTRITKIPERAVFDQADESGDGTPGLFAEDGGGGDNEDVALGDSGQFLIDDVAPVVLGAGGQDSIEADDATQVGENFVDRAEQVAQADLQVPLIFDEEQQTEEQVLAANFSFSADTVNVGEEVRFIDDSTGNPISWNWSFDDGTGAEGPDVTKAWETEGEWTVELFVRDDAGNEASQSKVITVVSVDVTPPPTANFNFRSATIEVGEAVLFEDDSTGDPEVFVWDFGDGSTGVGSSIEHAFDAPGVYDVELTVSNSAGSDATVAQITVISATLPPQAIIAQLPSRVIETGQSIQFRSESTNSPTSVSWNFGNGTAQGSEVRNSWSLPGTYDVRLTVSNSAGSDEAVTTILVQDPINPPIARFGQSDLQAFVDQPLSFNDLSLNNPDSITWEFGDNSSASGPNVSHAWERPGSYTITLRVENEAGFDELTKIVTILPPPPDPPIANFTIGSATVPVNSVLVFNDSSINDPAQWSWDFGDGSTSSAQNPTHAFSVPGDYLVELTVSNVSGADNVTKTIRVVDPPIANFSTTVSELVVDFSDLSSNGPTNWSWDFGDGTSSTAQNPTKTYAPGVYQVTLIASNAAGSSTPFVFQVTAEEAPDAAFSVTSSGLTAQFMDLSTKNPATWLWDFGDGTTSSSQDPSHTYATPDTYLVQLTTSNGAGADSVTQTVTVELAPPVAAFTCSAVGGGVACDGMASTGTTVWSWSSPNAAVSTGTATPTPSFTFVTSGTYAITLEAANAVGTTDTVTQDITVVVPQPPTIGAINVTANTNGVVELSAVASESPTGWMWTAPGAAIAGGATATPTLTYTTPGSKTITAVATNAVGSSVPFPTTIVVTIVAPPVVTNVATTPNAGGVVLLAGTATNGPVAWAWNIPGGTLAAGDGTSTPTFSFPSNGTYPGSVTATNPDGTSAPFTFSVTVSNLVPVVTSTSVTANAGGSATLFATASNSPTVWSWTMPGGTVTNGAGTSSPTYSFPANGTYTGTVVASNAAGNSAPATVTVVISSFPSPPVANFTWVEIAPPLEVRLSDASTAAPGATYNWNYGGGTQVGGSTTDPRVLYPGPGTYTVTLTVTDAGGTDTSTQTITVVD